MDDIFPCHTADDNRLIGTLSDGINDLRYRNYGEVDTTDLELLHRRCQNLYDKASELADMKLKGLT